MSEHFRGRIEVGGELHSADSPRFSSALGIGEGDVSSFIDNGHFVFVDGDASYGQFEELEQLCRELGLPYRRQSDGKYEFSPEIVFWQRGMTGPYQVITDQSGNMQVGMEKLRAIRDALVASNIPEACFLADRAVVDLPELPPFRVLEDVS